MRCALRQRPALPQVIQGRKPKKRTEKQDTIKIYIIGQGQNRLTKKSTIQWAETEKREGRGKIFNQKEGHGLLNAAKRGKSNIFTFREKQNAHYRRTV